VATAPMIVNLDTPGGGVARKTVFVKLHLGLLGNRHAGNYQWPRVRRESQSFALRLEFVHFGLTAKCQLTTALARLRERGDPACGMGEGFADFEQRKQPLTLGFAVPSPLGEGRYQQRPRCESRCRNSRARLKSCPSQSFAPRQPARLQET
jgi:hypothetical protein